MISQSDLLKLLEEAIQTEELLIGIYSGDCMALVEKAESDADKIAQHRDFFRELRDESRRHRRKLETLRTTVKTVHAGRNF